MRRAIRILTIAATLGLFALAVVSQRWMVKARTGRIAGMVAQPGCSILLWSDADWQFGAQWWNSPREWLLPPEFQRSIIGRAVFSGVFVPWWLIGGGVPGGDKGGRV